nr:MAG TPA: hypothetical protein [Caudoviricetes sp.]
MSGKARGSRRRDRAAGPQGHGTAAANRTADAQRATRGGL